MLSGRVALVTGGARGERDCCDACWLQICNIKLDIEEREHLQAFRAPCLLPPSPTPPLPTAPTPKRQPQTTYCQGLSAFQSILSCSRHWRGGLSLVC